MTGIPQVHLKVANLRPPAMSYATRPAGWAWNLRATSCFWTQQAGNYGALCPSLTKWTIGTRQKRKPHRRSLLRARLPARGGKLTDPLADRSIATGGGNELETNSRAMEANLQDQKSPKRLRNNRSLAFAAIILLCCDCSSWNISRRDCPHNVSTALFLWYIVSCAANCQQHEEPGVAGRAKSAQTMYACKSNNRVNLIQTSVNVPAQLRESVWTNQTNT